MESSSVEVSSSETAQALTELLQFLEPSQRTDIKSIAVMNLLSLSASKAGRSSILYSPKVIQALLRLVQDVSSSENCAVANDAIFTLVNLMAEPTDAEQVFEISKKMEPSIDIIAIALHEVKRKESSLAEAYSKLLSNMTRVPHLTEEVLNLLETDFELLKDLLNAFVKVDVKVQKSGLHYMSSVFCNLTQSSRGRELIGHNIDQQIFEKILSFVNYEQSLIRRGGAVGILKNLCFDERFHKRLLTDTDDEILSTILYPLCGPEEYTDEENEKLPLDLQYLPSDKKREDDPDLRKMLLDSLLQLCATRPLREHLRNKGVYEVLREYHKWESANKPSERDCLLSCENVVDILIRKEEEIGVDDYRNLVVPEDLTTSFVQQDKEYFEENY